MLARTFWIILAVTLFASPATAEPIRVAYSGVSAAGTPLWLAEDGIFARHGLEADLVPVRTAPLQVSALVSNEVQSVRGSASSMLSAAAQGAKLKILLSLFAEEPPTIFWCLDQRILQKIVQSGYVEEIERKFKFDRKRHRTIDSAVL